MTDRPRQQPLKPDILWILLALVEGPRHGYGILVWIREESGDAIEIGTGQLYRKIKRLLDDDWIVECEVPEDEAGGDERRRYYRLTAAGRARVEAESRRLQQMVRLSRRFGLLVEETP
ncbi:MAG: helix-turn-helix transcriptional regulator [Acidobacteriota bacterium]